MYRDDLERSNNVDRNSEDVYSKPVRAGKRTYFFDVKSTKGNNDFYLTITESKRRNNQDGSFTFDKHKIFLYKEDFTKFTEGLEEVIAYVRENCLGGFSATEGSTAHKDSAPSGESDSGGKVDFSDVDFEEL